MRVVTVIPHDQVPSGLLSSLLESFISREGTDYGEVERSLDEKVSELREQLNQGEIHIVFDGESETFTLITDRDARALGML